MMMSLEGLLYQMGLQSIYPSQEIINSCCFDYSTLVQEIDFLKVIVSAA